MRCSLGDQFQSTYQASFKVPPPGQYAIHTSPIPQTDETLIAGHFSNNLQVNGKTQTTKVWPKCTANVEDYQSYVKHLERTRNDIHKLYFKEECLGTQCVEKMLMDPKKSNYQHSFSPGEYQSLHDRNKCSQLGSEPTGMKYFETTYATAYRHVDELGTFKTLIAIKRPDKARPFLDKRTKKMMKTGRTTYWSEICFPAIIKSEDHPRREVPLDRYTTRKI